MPSCAAGRSVGEAMHFFLSPLNFGKSRPANEFPGSPKSNTVASTSCKNAAVNASLGGLFASSHCLF